MAVGVLCISPLLLLSLHTKPTVDLGDFVMQKLTLPMIVSYIDDNVRVSKELHWGEIEESSYQLIFPEPLFSESIPLADLRNGWFIPGDGEDYHLYLDIVVINYRYPLLAWLQYGHLEPKRYFSSSGCWNPNYEPEDYIPRDWHYENEFVNREDVYCCNGCEDACDSWYYRARYGQYLIIVDVHGWRLDQSSFAQIVEAVNYQLFIEGMNFPR